MEVQAAHSAIMPPTSSSPTPAPTINKASIAHITHATSTTPCIRSFVASTKGQLTSSSSPSSPPTPPTPTRTFLPSLTTPITPENDPNPSWTFFPPSATYIPHPSSPASPTLSASPSSPTANRTSPSPPSLSHVNNMNNKNNIPTSTPTTHHRILDHCFHLSIETRLKQAEAQYLAATQEQAVEQQIKEQQELHQPPMSALKQDDWRRRQRTLVDEAVVLGRKGSNVEAIVDGILKSHRSSGPLQTLPRHLKHRLHLCQLTSMVYGRFDVASSTNNSAGLNIYSAFHSRRHGASRAAIQHHLAHSQEGQKTRGFFANPVPSTCYCRRHHRSDCQRTCCTLARMQKQQQKAQEIKKKMAHSNNNYYNNNANSNDARKQDQQRVAGLIDAIPAFLKCSAMSYRDIAQCMVDKGELKDIKDSKVLEGWYRLLLEMMTQAVIEAFLCDGTTGVDTILDVFSYGDDDHETEETVKDVIMDDSMNRTTVGVEELSFQATRKRSVTSVQYPPPQQHQSSPTLGLQEINTQDRQDDILFINTPEYERFKRAKNERLQEFLTLNGVCVEQHFVRLAAKYPVIVFERQMTHYIIRSQKLLVDPKLSQNVEQIGLLLPTATPAYADGSLSMPVSDDEDDEEMEVQRLEKIKEEDIEGSAILPLAAAAKHTSRPKVVSRQSHFPSPPPSVAASRASTVSPTSGSSLSEEESHLSSCSSSSSKSVVTSKPLGSSGSKKHKFTEEFEGDATQKVKAEQKPRGRNTIKKMKV